MSNNIEKDIEILENLKKYLQQKIDTGEHNIFYNDLGWDEKTIDCMNAISNIVNEYKKNQNIVEEIRSKINERQFELQQEYKDFKDDIRLNTLQEIYYMLVEDK